MGLEITAVSHSSSDSLHHHTGRTKRKIKIVTVMEFPAMCQRQYIELNNRAPCKNVQVFRNSCLNLAIILPPFLLCLHNYESPKFTLPKTQVCNCRYVPKRKIV